MITPTLSDYLARPAAQLRTPLVATLVWDDLTPLAAYARLERGSPRAFLFESVVGGERIARYSFVGVNPAESFVAHGARVELLRHADGGRATHECSDPLRMLEERMRARAQAAIPGLPTFLSGAVGYAAYDTVRYYERLPAAPPDDRGLPDVAFDFFDELVIFDHVRKLVRIAATPAEADGSPSAAGWHAAAARIEALRARLAEPAPLRPLPALPGMDGALRAAAPLPPAPAATSNFERAAFEAAVRRAQEYIRAGDIFQVVLSQRLRVDTAAEPLQIYRALRVINPSPFMFIMKSPEVCLVGASPEIMCRVQDGVIHNRPLAGTRRRGATEAEDHRLREELLADPKERAEHIMLVDLGRNDIGRVAEVGSVRLADVMAVEFYSHVMHISTHVTGALRAGLTAFDALRATLPVGTVSGAPKVRAMQIIDELEPTRRGPYAGAIGYIDDVGNLDTCIALRTMVLRPSEVAGRWIVDVQAGAGVVADSAPAAEYQETVNKAQSLIAAIAAAQEWRGA